MKYRRRDHKEVPMMKKIKIALLSAALLGGAIGIASASPEGGKGPISAAKRAEWAQKREERMTKMFEKIDANKDGKLTQAEVEAFAVKMADEQFAKMDTNKTGSIDLTQFKAFKSDKQARRFGRHHHKSVTESK
jgi:hypothetical protein